MPAKTSTRKPRKESTSPAKSFHFNTEATVEGFRESILNHLKFTLARDTETATSRDWWLGTSHALHDRVLERFIRSMAVHNQRNVRRVYYLSLEYLMGRMFRNNLFNTGLYETAA